MRNGFKKKDFSVLCQLVIFQAPWQLIRKLSEMQLEYPGDKLCGLRNNSLDLNRDVLLKCIYGVSVSGGYGKQIFLRICEARMREQCSVSRFPQTGCSAIKLKLNQ